MSHGEQRVVAAPPGDVARIPRAMRDANRWVCWTARRRDGRWTKVPVQPDGRPAKSNDPTTWCSLAEAMEATEGREVGVGFVLGDGWIGIDLDGVRDPTTGDLDAAAAEIVSLINSYTEASPSGTGLHVIAYGRLPPGRRRRGNIEAYDEGRYFTVTGEVIHQAPVEVRGDELAEFHAMWLADPDEEATGDVDTRGLLASLDADREINPRPTPLEPGDDDALIQRAENAANGHRFRSLWAGDHSGYGSQSEADLALCNLLAFFAGPDADRIDRLFRRSGLMRAKWDEPRGVRGTYGDLQIAKALDGRTEYWSPRQEIVHPPPGARSEDRETGTASDPGPIPERLLHVPGFIEAVIQHTLRRAPYPNRVLAFAGALALQAHLCGRKVADETDVRSNVYILALATSGSGKDAPRKTNKRILHAIGLGSTVGDRMASGEGLEEAIYRHPCKLFQTDEIDTLLRQIRDAKDGRQEAMLAKLLEVYTSSDSPLAMRARASDEGDRVVNQPHLTLFGTAIPDNYYGALSPAMLTNGFTARTLVLECGKRGRGQLPQIEDPPDNILETARWWASDDSGGGNLASENPVPRVIRSENAARDLLVQLQQKNDDRHDTAQSEAERSVVARIVEQARKLSLLYACSDAPRRPIVTADAARWGIAVAEYAAQRMLYQAGQHTAESELDARALSVMRKIQATGGEGIEHWRLLKATRLTSKQLREVIETLVERADVVEDSAPTGGRRGKVYKAG